MTTVEEIQKLKKEKNAVILAHYYVRPEVQEIADYIGDSFYLSKVATKLQEKTIVFCGVSFMGESAKILNPEKTVLMPDMTADCPMAHMADVETIRKMRKEYDDLAVVCYINSTAALKEYSDVCVTSANAVKIVKELPNKNIFFIPDRNLAHFVADHVPEKNFVYNNGFCPTHERMEPEDVAEVKRRHPGAQIVAHGECRAELLAMADYVGSTSGIIQYVTASDCQEFIVCTEEGVGYKLKEQNPVYKVMEVMPEFPGGMKALMDFIQKNIRYPEEARKNGIQGRVAVSVVIDENGRVTDPVIMRSRYPALDEEALRIVGLMPQWKPGMQQGKAVKVEFTFPVTFKLE